jgi:hypothetical protein
LFPIVVQAAGRNVENYRVLLEGDQAAIVIHQCMREAPVAIQDTWVPEAAVVQKLDTQLPDIMALTSTLCCGAGDRVANLNRYYLQYAGLVIEGHKLIYINALPADSANSEWRSKAVLSCAASTDYWGVLYDPENGLFSDLAFNGEPDDDEAH